MKVKDCMCNEVFCVKPETTVSQMAKIMEENHIGCIPVCDNKNHLCGILTDRDILLRTIACNKNPNSTTASDIMSTNVCTCKEEEEMTNAQNKMVNNQIRRLPVCDENDNVIGILTMGNLAQNDNAIGKTTVSSTINGICDCESHKNDQ